MNVCLVSANEVTYRFVMEHFAFPGNIDFAADDPGAFSCISHERLFCLFIVCETMFTISESRTISHANDTQAQQVAANPRRGRFSTKTPLERERRLEKQREQRLTKEKTSTRNRGAERTLLSIAQATPTTRDRGTGDWNIRGVMIVLHCGKPTFISLPVSLPTYRSKSAKFQLCTTARSILIFMPPALPYLCFVFVFF